MASLVRRVEDLIVKDGEVERKAETNWMGRCEVGSCDLSGRLVSFQRLVGRIFALVANGELGEIAVVVTLPVLGISQLPLRNSGHRKHVHLVVEHFRLSCFGGLDQVLVEHVQDVSANSSKLRLDLLTVFLDQPDL